MNRLLEASSDPLVVFLAFVLSTSIAHYFWVFKRPLSLKKWRLVDYMWLSLAAISIYGFVEEARFFQSQMAQETSRMTSERTQSALENWFEVYNEYACGEGAGHGGDVQFCRWTKVKISALDLINENEDFPVDIPANFLLGLDEVAAGISAQEREDVAEYLSAYRLEREHYLEASKNVRRSEISALIVALAPLLFALAIGIKFAKVTGEYRLTKR
ncbi:hypothetical protein KFE96_14015 [Kordiimonas sp. SCSIO 12603]|uniref:hypothetical protein n=1 Tax=Kordiimonas sp. SCSIO 12603 TaxID=2829596 RepID=UPI00210732EF|nr:hypothetical protein [Kordiimonas sp. SCSIO 12603]UTW57932.1 hypothetical protein KFE96_14015 [Kordiimonas sp. SCSIO 12603]